MHVKVTVVFVFCIFFFFLPPLQSQPLSRFPSCVTRLAFHICTYFPADDRLESSRALAFISAQLTSSPKVAAV